MRAPLPSLLTDKMQSVTEAISMADFFSFVNYYAAGVTIRSGDLI